MSEKKEKLPEKEPMDTNQLFKMLNDPELIKFMRSVAIGSSSISKRKQGEELTVDGHINKYGGIYSHADNKTHTTKSSYMEGLRATGKVIKDW